MVNSSLLSLCLILLFNFLPSASAKPKMLKLNVYYEPQNHESTAFFKEQLLPAYESGLLEKVSLKLVPFGNAACDASGEEYKCTCTNGDRECELMHLSACALHEYRNHADVLDLIGCIQGQPDFDQAYTHCFRKLSSRDSKWLAKCSHEFRGSYLFWINGLRTKALGFKLPMVPTVVLADQLNLEATFGLKVQLCRHFPDLHQCKET